MSLSRSLFVGELIRVLDSGTGETSDDFEVISASAPPAITGFRRLTGGELLINFEGVPGTAVQLERSIGLTAWIVTPLPTLDDVGTSFVEVAVLPGVPAMQFRIARP